MKTRSAVGLSRDAYLALSWMAAIAARADVPVTTRLALGLARDVLVDYRERVTWYVDVEEPLDVVEGLDRILVWLCRDVDIRGLAAWRSRRAAEVIRNERSHETS